MSPGVPDYRRSGLAILALTTDGRPSAWESIATAFTVLVAEPMAVVMTCITVILAVSAATPQKRGQRVLALILAVVSGVVAWMMATHWRWPR